MSEKSDLHVAIIMDGNGRWAQARGLPRPAGHQAGAQSVRKVVEAAVRLDVRVLTLYAFSSDNWKRPPAEVDALMLLFQRYLTNEARRCVENDVRVSVIGRRDRLRPRLVREIERMEQRTACGQRLHLRLAVDYSARSAILEAARRLPRGASPGPLIFSRLLNAIMHSAPAPDVDLLIRTGGEQRLSDFLLWECAYAEFIFSPCLWPDFGEADLAAALGEFERRERRYGGVFPPAVADRSVAAPGQA